MIYIEELGKLSREIAFDVRDGRIYGDEDEEIAAAVAAKVLRDVVAMSRAVGDNRTADQVERFARIWSIDLGPGEPVHEEGEIE